MPWSAIARCSATPKATPRMIPRRAPKTAMSTDSMRIMLRSWRRLVPTALSRPISRVRSTTLSTRVLMIPSTAMRTASASSA